MPPATRSTIVLVTWFLISSMAHGNDDQVTPDPLFQSHDILRVRIAAPLTTLLGKRPFEEDLAANFQYTDVAEAVVDLDIGIRTRGRFRRRADVCRFPPMRLNFKTSAVKGTQFHKQDKLKLVTHCNPKSRYSQSLLREYIAYRIFNVMTNASYNVRLLEITYVDTDGGRDEEVQFGFFIEHKDRLSKRLNKSVMDVPRTFIRDLDKQYTNLTSVFQYLIGNTDFSPIQVARGETCCHNHVLYGNEGEPLFSIPYDFDQAGIVDAPHAVPNRQFNLRNVQQRLYRGRCVNNEHLAATIELYRERRQMIEYVVEEAQPLTARTRKMVLKYIDKFYGVIESESKMQRALIKSCK